MRRSQRRIIPLVIAGGLCAVAIIWSVHAAPGARGHAAPEKMPRVYTGAGPEAPTGLTAAEARKRETAVPANPDAAGAISTGTAAAVARNVRRETIGPSESNGLTPAEREKLESLRERVAASASAPPKQEISTVGAVPRAPGYDGMTAAEKAKWQRHVSGKDGEHNDNR